MWNDWDCQAIMDQQVEHRHTFLSHLAFAFAQCTQAMGIRSLDASIFGHEQGKKSERATVSGRVLFSSASRLLKYSERDIKMDARED